MKDPWNAGVATKNLRFVVMTLLGAGLLLLPSPARAQVVTTLAGSGLAGSADGDGVEASFTEPRGVAADSSGNVYVADTRSLKIRKITSGGQVTTLAGSGLQGYNDGIGANAKFLGPLSVAVDASGNVWVADDDGGCDFCFQYVKKITPDGFVHNLALYPGGSPQEVSVDDSGNLHVLDRDQGLWKITPGGESTRLPLSGGAYSVAGAQGLAVDRARVLYIAGSNRVMKIAPSGAVTMLLGSGAPGNADGPGVAAGFRDPTGVAVDASGNTYVADRGNHAIRKITPDGIVTTLAGSGIPGAADGTGTDASFNSPSGVALDGSGNLYVADSGNNKIRRIALPKGRVPAAPSGVLDLSVPSTDATVLLRFDETTGQMSLDTLDKTGSVTAGSLFGPYEGWTPRATATGLDGLTRVLWNHEDGSAALWLTGPDGNQASFLLNPVRGATATDVAAAPDGTTHLLWTHEDGSVGLRGVDGSGRVLTNLAYGPYEGWTASAISDGADGLTRLLWNNADGRTALSIHSSQGLVVAHFYGPVPDWSAADITAGGDALTHILWAHEDGRIAFWRIDAAGKPTGLGPIYPPPRGFAASRIAAGPDGLTRVLWTDPGGNGLLWILSADDVFRESIDLGPGAGRIVGEWTGTFYSADVLGCGGGKPAEATFFRDGERVVGTLNTTQTGEEFCGFGPVGFDGTLRRGRLTGLLTGDLFSYGSQASGTLAGQTLEIELHNSFGVKPGGRLHLHRVAGQTNRRVPGTRLARKGEL